MVMPFMWMCDMKNNLFFVPMVRKLDTIHLCKKIGKIVQSNK